MNITLWIIQCMLGIAFLVSGIIIMFVPKEKTASKLSWVMEYSDGMRFFICAAKIAGAIGLILPMYLNIAPILTPISAMGIAAIMILAIAYHLRKKEYKEIPTVILILALTLFIAYNRF